MAKRVWVTGASSGLGLALVEQLLVHGALVAASGRVSDALRNLAWRNPTSLMLLDGQLTSPLDAATAARQFADRWEALDCLIINAGTCDYLAADTPASALFEGIVSSNLSAACHCLDNTLALLQGSRCAQVAGILSRYSSLQLHEPSQPARPDNSMAQLFGSYRGLYAGLGIDLTLVAPVSLKTPVTPLPVAPEPWTPQSAAEAVLTKLADRPDNLVLEVLNQNSLWPLPE